MQNLGRRLHPGARYPRIHRDRSDDDGGAAEATTEGKGVVLILRKLASPLDPDYAASDLQNDSGTDAAG